MAGGEESALAGGVPADLNLVRPLRQQDPDVEAALATLGDGQARLGKLLTHVGRRVADSLSQPPEMSDVLPGSDQVVDEALGEVRGGDRGEKLDVAQGGCCDRVRRDVAHPQRRRQGLGEGADVDLSIRLVQRRRAGRDRRQDVGERVVLDETEPMLPGEGEEALGYVQRERTASGVVSEGLGEEEQSFYPPTTLRCSALSACSGRSKS